MQHVTSSPSASTLRETLQPADVRAGSASCCAQISSRLVCRIAIPATCAKLGSFRYPSLGSFERLRSR
jgi:hypothetical protein